MSKAMIISKIVHRLWEVVIFSLTLILPFSFQSINKNWSILFMLAVIFISVVVYLNFFRPVTDKYLFPKMIISIFFLVIFNFMEDFGENRIFQFFGFNFWIPISTILLSIAILLYLMKALYDGVIMFPGDSFSRSYALSYLLLLSPLVLFYPLVVANYSMDGSYSLQLITKLVKYLLVWFLISNYLSENTNERIKKISLVMLVSIVSVIALTFIL